MSSGLRPKGEDTDKALREWVGEEIKGTPASRLELGKFFFSVSSATLALVVTLRHFDKTFAPLFMDWIAFLFLGVSLFVALFMVMPRMWSLRGEANLYAEHGRHTRYLENFIWAWFAFWFVGSAIMVYDITSHPMPSMAVVSGTQAQ